MRNPFAEALGEAVAPALIDAWTPLDYVPNARQKIFHELSDQRINAILYGGSAGSGKSAACLMDAMHHAVNHPGMRIGCFRRTYGELEESFLAELAKRGYADAIGGKWNASKYTLKFTNGSTINFSYAENEVDVSRILGGEYQAMYVDEATLMPPVVLQRLEERLRSGRRDLPVIGLRLASNPGGLSHTHIKERFIKATNKGRDVITDEDGRTIAFIPARYTDNQFIDKGYERVLNSIPDPQRRKAMRDGDWDAVSGAFFEQFHTDKHVIPLEDTFTPPMEWQRYCGVDYGIRAPFAVVWSAVDQDGRVWLYREIHATGVDAHDQAHMILAAERAESAAFDTNLSFYRVGDPAMWGNRGTPLTIADIYGLEGCGLAQADNNRINGWARFHMFLNDDTACEYHKSKGLALCPMLHVFEGFCPKWIDTIPALPHSPTDPDDAQKKNTDDHLADATRYMLMAIGTYGTPVLDFSDTDSSAPSDFSGASQLETLAPFGRFAASGSDLSMRSEF